MDRYRRRHQRALIGTRAICGIDEESTRISPSCGIGQGTVEYALVVAGVLIVAVGFSLIAHAVAEGGIAQGVLDSLTHRLPKGVLDAMLF